jgi:hypothetical protein
MGVGVGDSGLKASIGLSGVTRDLNPAVRSSRRGRTVGIECALGDFVSGIRDQSLGRGTIGIKLGIGLGRSHGGADRSVLELGETSVGHGRVGDGSALGGSFGGFGLFGGVLVGSLLHVSV